MIRKWCLTIILYALVYMIVYLVASVKSRGTYKIHPKTLDIEMRGGYALLRFT